MRNIFKGGFTMCVEQTVSEGPVAFALYRKMTKSDNCYNNLRGSG